MGVFLGMTYIYDAVFPRSMPRNTFICRIFYIFVCVVYLYDTADGRLLDLGTAKEI